jgi:probable rRNA maturation factor
MKPRIGVWNRQRVVEVADMPEWLEGLGEILIGGAMATRTAEEAPLGGLEEIEVTLLDDREMARVHGEFMDDPTPTDVITFDHGEILIGVETAVRQAAEFGEPLRRELLRYLVHGLLHLAGHRDGEESARETMHAEQERIVAGIELR